MARLPKGEKPTPAHIRRNKLREDLAERGGARLIADLEPDAYQALLAVMQRGGDGAPLSKKDAVSQSLLRYAAELSKT